MYLLTLIVGVGKVAAAMAAVMAVVMAATMAAAAVVVAAAAVAAAAVVVAAAAVAAAKEAPIEKPTSRYRIHCSHNLCVAF